MSSLLTSSPTSSSLGSLSTAFNTSSSSCETTPKMKHWWFWSFTTWLPMGLPRWLWQAQWVTQATNGRISQICCLCPNWTSCKGLVLKSLNCLWCRIQFWWHSSLFWRRIKQTKCTRKALSCRESGKRPSPNRWVSVRSSLFLRKRKSA